jgi:hypothetical protein
MPDSNPDAGFQTDAATYQHCGAETICFDSGFHYVSVLARRAGSPTTTNCEHNLFLLRKHLHSGKFINLAMNILFKICSHDKLKLKYRIPVPDLEPEP